VVGEAAPAGHPVTGHFEFGPAWILDGIEAAM
jgi:hypothetical protein